MLDKAFIKRMEEKLLLRKKELEKELSSVSEKDPNAEGHFEATFPNYGDEEEENVSEIGAFTTNLSLEKIFEGSLRDVTNALERIKDGTYGICKHCGKEIQEARLEARPESSSCISCKQRL